MAIISKHLLFTVLFLVAGFLLAFSEPPDNRRPPRSPSRHRSPSTPRPSSPPPPRPSPPPPPLKLLPGFDYFMLALQWPNTFCYTSSICKTTKPIRQYFTIHGLWPQKNTGRFPLNCDTNKRMTDDILEKFKTDLLQYWPRLFSPDNFGYSKKFWIEQWDRHGTCSSDKYSQEDYLKTTIALGKKYGPIILDKMKEKGIKPNRTTPYSKKHTLEAIKEATKTVAHLLCSTDSGKNELLEIRLCFEADGKTLRNCKSNNKDDDCKKDFIFPSSLTETHSRFPSFMSSILDVEEAVGI